MLRLLFVLVSSKVIANDCDILALFGNCTTATTRMGWNTSGLSWCCHAAGVTCEGNDVVALNLTAKSIAGQFPLAFARLTNLRSLDCELNMLNNSLEKMFLPSSLEHLNMESNQLSGELPNWLLEFPSLSFLDLGNNSLTGNIPPQKSPLKSLNLAMNHFSGSLPPFQRALTSLSLAQNNLTGSIESVGLLQDLESLELSANKLDGSLEPVQYLSRLQSLTISFNALTGNVTPVEGLTALTRLYLAQNHLTGNLNPLSSLTKLEMLSLWSNALTGPLSPLEGLSRLTALHLEKNSLTGSLDPLAMLTNLTYLVVVENNLTGSLAALAHWPQLEWAFIDHNDFEGTLEPVSGLQHLEQLTVQNTKLQGTIAPILQLKMLKAVNVSVNNFVGDLDLSTLPNLQEFRGYFNRFSGAVALPPSIEFFDVSNNLLSEFKAASLPELRMYNISCNRFEEFSDLSLSSEHPTLMDIRDNSFRCPYPEFDSLVAIARTPCVYSWTDLGVLGLIILGSVLVGFLLYFACRKRWRSLESLQQFSVIYFATWSITALGTVSTLSSLWEMYWYVIREAENQALACRIVDSREVFFLVFTEITTPPLPGNTLKEYVAAFYRETELKLSTLEINLAEFADLCAAFPRCEYLPAPDYTCAPQPPAPSHVEFLWDVFVAAVVFCAIELFKLLPMLFILCYGERALQGHKAHLVARSMFSPLLLVCCRPWFVPHVVCLQSVAWDHLFELGYGGIPTVSILFLLCYYHLTVLQTDWTLSIYVSIFVNALNVVYLLTEARLLCCPLDKEAGWNEVPRTSENLERARLSNAYRATMRQSMLRQSMLEGLQRTSINQTAEG